MSGYDLIQDIEALTKMLDSALSAYRKRGDENAKAEYEYRVALSEEIAKLRADGTPVSIVADMARGDRRVAKLRLERDLKEVAFKAAGEAIQNYKLQIRVKDAQVQREWGGSK